jgi:hypothetical protein
LARNVQFHYSLKLIRFDCPGVHRKVSRNDREDDHGEEGDEGKEESRCSKKDDEEICREEVGQEDCGEARSRQGACQEGFFDLAAVRGTVATAREFNKPYAVVINAAPVKREDKEAPAVALSRAQFERLSVPVWSGQISQRAAFLGSLAAGASASEIYGDSACKVEIARLWSAIERSVGAINRAQADAAGKAA